MFAGSKEVSFTKVKQPEIHDTEQWRIQGFLKGAATLEGVSTYYLANFSWKLRERDEILEGGRVPRAP